jgi:acetaldehyde dehydrogenase (acetylating)
VAAPSSAPAQTDRDLASISEARTLARRAKQAQTILGEFSQTQVDAIVDAMAAAVTPYAEPLARLAVEETTFGVVADKVQKNLFASKNVYEFIRPLKTVGVINRIEDKKVIEIAEPFGVVAAIVPSTNPTSTAIYKILISIKARCAIVISPHPSAARCITRTAEVMYDAARKAGLPEGGIGWLTTVTLEGTQELMKQREVSVILATGGMGLVRAAYSAGKPAYGVGPGNAPCYVEQSADLAKAAADIIVGKAFDHGVLCSSPNSIVVDEAVEREFRQQLEAQGGYFLSAGEADALAKVLVTTQRLPNPALVGKSALHIAQKIGITVPAGTQALIAELKGVGRDYPLSIEKLCPVLSYYVVKDWREGCERCKEILRYGGMGHTMSIHSRNDQVILEFGLHKPAYRICVNTPTTHGSIGLSTGLDPAMTLGCGGFGGNITSDNISPRHLLNIKRVAYELRPVTSPGLSRRSSPAAQRAEADAAGSAAAPRATPSLPRAPAKPEPEPIPADQLTRRIDAFLAARGIASALAASASPRPGPSASFGEASPMAPAAPAAPAQFVCEEDVRTAVKAGQKILVGEKTIITPAARDAGEAGRVFVWQSYPLSQ